MNKTVTKLSTIVPKRSEGTSGISRFATAKLLIILSLLSIINIPQVTASNQSTLEVEAFDSIAGYTTMAQIEDALPYEDIEIMITKPNGSEITIETKTDENGETEAEINGYHLKTAGNYEIKAKYSSLDETYGQTDSFKVYEDIVSTNKSTLETDNTTAEASGSDPIQLTVYLEDRYGNPIKNHTINIISSRNEDYITPYESTETSSQGKVVFYAYSKESGISTYTAYDQTSGTTLEARAKVAYISPSTSLSDIGGDNLFTSILMASEDSGTVGTIDHFKIEDLSEEVILNELLNFTVTAYDANENVVTDYTGAVRFSSSDDNSTLPEDYTFKAEDQGSHTFSLSLRFATTGTQTLTVTNTSNRDLQGEFEVNVTEGESSQSGSNTPSSSSEDITITNPQSGTYSSTTVKVEGTAAYGSTVGIYDNNTELTQVQAQQDNSFEIELELEAGTHSLYAKTDLGQSETVDITIDTEAPVIDYVETSTEGAIEAGSTFDITLYSEPGLREVGLILEDKIYELSESIDQEGTYTGILVAPEAAGIYEIDTILVDELGNEIQYGNQLTISVMAKESTDEPDTTPEEIPEETITVNPSKVEGLEAINEDSKVVLTWEAATSGSEDTVINNYKIYYGPEADLLYSTATTMDSSTTWYIPNLGNGTTYYFAVTAIDSQGNESLEKSAAVSGTPIAELHESAPEEPSIEDLGTPDETAESGPGLVWIILTTIVFAEIYFKAKKSLRVSRN
ncbi:MAG: fibronectin type III domain-containing protein [Candidatus Gracilibacteria bacterium]|jgi:hypothetical protein